MHDVVLVSNPEEPVRDPCHVLRARPVKRVVLLRIMSPGRQEGPHRQWVLVQKYHAPGLSVLPNLG